MFSRTNNYGSGISTASPLGQADYRRVTSGKQAYRGPDQSRSAFSRALLDTDNASMLGDMTDFDKAYRQKAEQARAQDVQSRRESELQNYALGEQRRVTTKRQDTFRQQKSADLEAYLDRARKDANAATIGNVAQLVLQGVLLAAPTAGQMYRMANPQAPTSTPMEPFRWGGFGNDMFESPFNRGLLRGGVNDTSSGGGLFGGRRQ